jgi:propionyl-CoA synthetase
MFTAPTSIRAIKREDPNGDLIATSDLSSLERLYLAGERCDPTTATWLSERLNVPVIDHWWQTETGWPITANFPEFGLFPSKLGTAGRPTPGFVLNVLDERGVPVETGTTGNLAIRLPLPPGGAPTLWRNDSGFRSAYLNAFPGWYVTGDAGKIDTDGDVWVMGRTDDVINVAGHRLSTGTMEEVIASHPDVAECAVIGIPDELKGEIPLGIVVLKRGFQGDVSSVRSEVITLIRNRIGPVAAFKQVAVVDRLPKTRSGKILRGTMRRIANGEQFVVPPTIEDASVLQAIALAFRARNKVDDFR